MLQIKLRLLQKPCRTEDNVNILISYKFFLFVKKTQTAHQDPTLHEAIKLQLKAKQIKEEKKARGEPVEETIQKRAGIFLMIF